MGYFDGIVGKPMAVGHTLDMRVSPQGERSLTPRNYRIEISGMLSDYMSAVMHHAQYCFTQDGKVSGVIPDLEGVTAHGETLEDCRHNLSEALEEWIFFRASRHLPVPTINGVQLQIADAEP
jgi:predicted RNase H-like HicB family nuclease